MKCEIMADILKTDPDRHDIAAEIGIRKGRTEYSAR